MALHGSQTAILLDGFDLTSFFKEFHMEASVNMLDATVFGNSSRVKVPGLKDGKASGMAFHDPTLVTGSWVVLSGKYGASTPGSSGPAAVTLAPSGFALGNRVQMGYFDEASLAFQSMVEGLEMITFNGESDQDAIDYGFSLHALAAEVGTVNGSSVDNAAATANGGVGVLHVTAIAGGAPSVVIKIQHATDNSTWIDLLSFTASTVANTVQRIEVAAATTIRRYLRIVCTFGGTTTSITFHVSFARR